MEKIKKRNLKTQMGKSFFDWASDFFTNEKNLNTLIEKSIIYEDFKKNVPRNAANLSINRFKKKIQIYCEYNEWIFNPDKYTDKTGRIIERNNQGKTVEYFYICAISDEMPF
jgi:GTPase Era involved in 16S rRNA processing